MASAMTPGALGIVHVHSAYSHDGKDTLESLVNQARRRSIDFICLGDHAEDLTSSQFASYRDHCEQLSAGGVQLIPGLEFRFAGFTGLHLLAIGLREWMAPETPEEFFEQARHAATLTMLAHPLLARFEIPEIVRSQVDAVEVWNARYNTRYLPDPRAIDLLREMRSVRPTVVGIAGLDQHDSANDRQARVRTTGIPSDALADLRAGRFVNIGRYLTFGSAAEFTPAALAALRVSRELLDRANRLHDRLSWPPWRRSSG